MADSLIERYNAQCYAGRLRHDPVQEEVARRLDRLARELRGYTPAARRHPVRKLLGRPPPAPPRSLYLHGGVGRGKSMLMDLFFDCAPASRKRRVHFHEFMLGVHERLNRWRNENRDRQTGEAPMPVLGQGLARETTLLCLDEFQVTNIADAMILARLFTNLFDLGVVLVATSNTAPADLYKGGLQRELFLPFIDLLHDRADILLLEGETDYRLDRLDGVAVYHTPLDMAAESALEAAFATLTDHAPDRPHVLEVNGRHVELPRYARRVAFCRFGDLCEKPLGSADYLALAREIHTLVLADIPRMGPEKRNEAERFITLIDALYDHRVKLVCAAATRPEALYMGGPAADRFKRTASRLVEMQSAAYIHLPHVSRLAADSGTVEETQDP